MKKMLKLMSLLLQKCLQSNIAMNGFLIIIKSNECDYCHVSNIINTYCIIVGGKRPGGPCQFPHWAKSPVQGKTPPRPWKEPSSAWM